MDIYQLPKQPFTSTGSQIEDKLSNSFSNEIDLLVRESVQNSLDAVDESSEQSFVKVDYYIKEFDQENLLHHIDSFKLLKGDYKYKKALIIKDTGTLGVDGEPDKSDSSYYRLLFDSNNPQNKASSGGSSGEGKTLYYKLGIGLVVYYTRIKKNNSYESRLNISYMENEKVLLERIPNFDKDSYTGICWWGKSNKTSKNSVAPILPINDTDEIEDLLKVFNVKPFDEDETGTMVVVPFFKNKELLDVNSKYPWTTSVEKYLRHSVQKWYCFRLDNTRYPNGKYLKVSVNDEKVSVRYQFFKYLKKLYNQIYTAPNDPLGSIKEIKLRNVDGIAGTLSYVVLKKDQVNFPNNIQEPTPFQLLFNDSENSEEEQMPYVVYTRKLGMVINYSKPPFNNHIIKIPNDSYLIGVFSLNGEATITKKNDKERVSNIYNLEEYYRKMETSTHELWEDKRVGKYVPPFPITHRIFNQIHSAIKSNLDKDTENIKDVPIDFKLASKVGKAFMPNIGQDRMGNVQGGTGSGGGTGGTGREPAKHKKRNGFVKHKDKCSLNFTENYSPIYTIYGTIKSYNTLYITKEAKKVSITVDLNSILGTNPLTNYKEWKKDFPVTIKKLSYKDKFDDRYIAIKKDKMMAVEDGIVISYDSNEIQVISEKEEILTMDLLIEYSVDGVYETSITLAEEEVKCLN